MLACMEPSILYRYTKMASLQPLFVSGMIIPILLKLSLLQLHTLSTEKVEPCNYMQMVRSLILI
ncbi:hypothetical protein B1H58_04005 [Pantoea alhagi]|uniref:Uncharacterized protein n=1 Tax=Pantoea alhagi TaxID=1891675 RepID=A0A1W6B2F3_9GAMM|nr:hypothetical protein B1H58_04005 [Pantoea alhagi]